MADDFKAILKKCEFDDFSYLCKVLHSYITLDKPGKLQLLLLKYQQYPDIIVHKEQIINEVDHQLRYFGSSNLAYFKRAVLTKDGGNSASIIVNDVYAKLRVKSKKGPSSIETRLKRLVKDVVEQELLQMNAKQLAQAFESIGMGDADINSIMEKIHQNGKIAILPALINILGPEITLNVIESIVVNIIAQVTGTEAAKQLTKQVLKRNPWINALGPVVWLISSSWFAYDMQGPAFRKTVPACLYLGMIEMRQGQSIRNSECITQIEKIG